MTTRSGRGQPLRRQPLRSRSLGSRLRRGNDRGSLPMALLLTLVGVSLSALLVPIVVTQVNSTRVDARQVNALNAAHTGLQAALGQIRDVPRRTKCNPLLDLGIITIGGCSLIGVGLLGIGIDLVVFNKPDGLPCGSEQPIQGSVGAGSTAIYSVTINFLPDDPRRHDDQWIQQHDACSDNSISVSYALVRSVGTDQGRTRTLEATYMFETPHRNSTDGGLIDVHLGSRNPCMTAGSNPPKPGDALQVATCAAGSAKQTFSYNRDLTIRLDASPGMCLQAGGPGSNVTFQPCTSPPSPAQQWVLNDSGNFEGVTSGLKPAGLCFNLTVLGSGDLVGLGSCQGTTLNWHAPPDGRPFRDIRER